MDRHKLYLLTLSLVLLSTVVVLAALRENRLDVYVSLFTLEYFTTSVVYSPKRRTIDLLGIILFTVFSFIIALKIIEILV